MQTGCSRKKLKAFDVQMLRSSMFIPDSSKRFSMESVLLILKGDSRKQAAKPSRKTLNSFIVVLTMRS